jgi:hypothetical protein
MMEDPKSALNGTLSGTRGKDEVVPEAGLPILLPWVRT